MKPNPDNIVNPVFMQNIDPPSIHHPFPSTTIPPPHVAQIKPEPSDYNKYPPQPAPHTIHPLPVPRRIVNCQQTAVSSGNNIQVKFLCPESVSPASSSSSSSSSASSSSSLSSSSSSSSSSSPLPIQKPPHQTELLNHPKQHHHHSRHHNHHNTTNKNLKNYKSDNNRNNNNHHSHAEGGRRYFINTLKAFIRRKRSAFNATKSPL